MKIFKEIEKHIEISEDEKKILLQSLKFRKIKKGDIVLKQNESSNFLGFIDKGILRSYAKDESNNDTTYHFFEQESFFSDLAIGVISGLGSEGYIAAIRYAANQEKL